MGRRCQNYILHPSLMQGAILVKLIRPSMHHCSDIILYKISLYTYWQSSCLFLCKLCSQYINIPNNQLLGCIACKTIASQFGLRCIQMAGRVQLMGNGSAYPLSKVIIQSQVFVHITSQIIILAIVLHAI